MSRFLGTYEHQLDDKGRVSLPSAFRRQAEGDRFVLLQWEASHLTLFPQARWEEIQEELLDFRRTGSEAAHYVRGVLARAVEVSPDKQGRILVPAWLQEGGGLDGSVLLNGNIDRVELWDPETFRTTVATDAEATRAVADFASRLLG